MKRIESDKLPTAALQQISKDQLSYLDEFSFYQLPNGRVHAFYANELISIWNGKDWQQL
jgi:hypothetical protein